MRTLVGPWRRLRLLLTAAGSFHMLKLLLLRHAKSSWDNEDLDDHERPLAKRGAKEAPLIGRLLASGGQKPDTVLCSTAVRARATLTLVLSALDAPPPAIVYDDALYLATPERLLERLGQVEGSETVMIIGHNPGLHALALSLTGEGARKDLTALATGFPTAGLAVLEFAADQWRDIVPGTGRLALLASPKRLPDEMQ
jgi:phosphohistidine phosphatase